MINHWLTRKLKVLGRISVITKPVIPKITYLFIYLLIPPGKLLNEIKNMVFNFIWQTKPDRIKTAELVHDYRYGCVKLVERIRHNKKSSVKAFLLMSMC